MAKILHDFGNWNGFYSHHCTVPMPLAGLREVTGDVQLWVSMPWTIISATWRNGSEGRGGKEQKPTESFAGLHLKPLACPHTGPGVPGKWGGKESTAGTEFLYLGAESPWGWTRSLRAQETELSLKSRNWNVLSGTKAGIYCPGALPNLRQGWNPMQVPLLN